MSHEKWPTWIVSYGYEGKQWCMDICAPTAEDAKKRLEAAAAWGQVDGELVARVPLVAGGFLVPFICWIRNCVSRVASKAKEVG
jgi:hypothetical protein